MAAGRPELADKQKFMALVRVQISGSIKIRDQRALRYRVPLTS
jgi:hypothetical protein